MLDFLGYALAGGLILLLIAYLTRSTAVKRLRVLTDGNQQIESRSESFNMHLNLLTGTHIVGGNGIEVLLNGDETFPQLWQDLKRAKQVICLHVFYFKPGKVADELLRILSERAQSGVQVFMLLDAVGAGDIGKDYRRRLTAAGAEVAIYRPLRFKSLYKFQQRMHIRAVVIDGSIGLTGGFGIADQWLGDGRSPGAWRDTNVRVEGPVAMQLQVAFSINWAEATGDLLVGDLITPFASAPPISEPKAAGIMTCTPSLGTTNAERFFFLAIASARERIYISNAYFVPTRDLRWLLMNAADRGVDVRVLTPGANSDQALSWHASRSYYEQLLQAGVRIYDYRPTMMHAKTFVADSCWATVGTFNFDNRSMKLNDEVALIIRDEAIAQQLEGIFMDDLRVADEVTQDDLRRRAHELSPTKARLARLLTPLL